MTYKKWVLDYYEKDNKDVYTHRVRVFKNFADVSNYVELHHNDERIRVENIKAVW